VVLLFTQSTVIFIRASAASVLGIGVRAELVRLVIRDVDKGQQFHPFPFKRDRTTFLVASEYVSAG